MPRFVDTQGREAPPDGWYGPGHVYVGSLRRGRVCWLTTGRKMKVLHQGESTTTVRYSSRRARVFTTSDGETVTIKRSSREQAIAKTTVVALEEPA